MNDAQLKIGLFAIGLDAYWAQFEGLKERLENYLSVGARKFVNEWSSYAPAHHCAVGVGHISSKLKKPGQLLNIDVAQVC